MYCIALHLTLLCHALCRGVSSFSESEARALARQIASGVAYLHEHGVVHCDLKPSNILVEAPAVRHIHIRCNTLQLHYNCIAIKQCDLKPSNILVGQDTERKGHRLRSSLI